MSRPDIASIAKRAPALKKLVVLSMPDSLLIDHWASVPADAESLAALFGAALQSARQTSNASVGKKNPDLVSIETAEALIFVVPLDHDMAAGFVFDRSTSLGLARIQIRDMLVELEPAMRAGAVKPKPPAAVPLPVPVAEQITTINPAITTVNQPAVNVPEPMPIATAVAPPSVAASAELSTVSDAGRPRAVRLLEFLHRYAPDPHVSMLRLSLRTGIALEKLDRPELLTNEQVEAMAASVRDIIGQEQLGI